MSDVAATEGFAGIGNLLDLAPGRWPDYFKQQLGVPAFHGRNAARWVFQRGADQWQQMTDMPAALRQRLDQELPLLTSTLEKISHAPDGASKILLRFGDDSLVEAVGMPGTQGRTLCLSTQVGCAVKCAFCASGMEGVARNLTPAEILQQVLWLRREQGDFHRLVIMGMGEPGHNLEAVLAALDALMAKEGSNFAARRITLSTVAPKGTLPRLAEWGRQVSVAISLHAATDELRHELVPGVRKRAITETLAEADRLFFATGREYTIEYVLLRDQNDSPEQARELANLLQDRRCHVNLIPYNPVPELPFARPDDAAMGEFAKVLRGVGLPVTLRASLGGNQDAACGQLRRRTTTQPPGSEVV